LSSTSLFGGHVGRFSSLYSYRSGAQSVTLFAVSSIPDHGPWLFFTWGVLLLAAGWGQAWPNWEARRAALTSLAMDTAMGSSLTLDDSNGLKLNSHLRDVGVVASLHDLCHILVTLGSLFHNQLR